MARLLRLLPLAALISGPAFANCDALGACTFQVNSALDGADTTPGNGLCVSGLAGCTLRAAIMEANARFQADNDAGPFDIHLQAATYRLAIDDVSAPDSEAQAGGLNVTARGVRIHGHAMGGSILTGSASFSGRLISIDQGGALEISDLELAEAGHGISCSSGGALTVQSMRFHDLGVGHADGPVPQGAAIQANGCSVEISDSQFWNNFSGSRGSALILFGSGTQIVRVHRSAFIGNGGAMINNNVAGATIFASSTNVFLDNVTVAGNLVGTKGALALEGGDTLGGYSFGILNSTIARNVSLDGTGTAGLYFTYGEGSIENSVIADNSADQFDIWVEQLGKLFSGGYNVLGPIQEGGIGSDVVTTALDRTAAENVGIGPVPAMPGEEAMPGLLPLAGGLLRDMGNPSPLGSAHGCQPLDTRAFSRAAGGRCDIGAYEVLPGESPSEGGIFADGFEGS